MPWTLYGYILRELVKVLAMSAAVLTAVMSVAFAIMSISEAQLGPWAMVKIIAYILPGMLTIALPFSAALAGTLVFFRMSQDNEVTACAVSGISYRSLLTPVLVLGLVLTGGMFWFSNWVVPRFWRMAEREGTSDAVRLAVRKIEQRQEIEWRGWLIYADAAAIVDPAARRQESGDPRPYSRLVLRGVAVGKVDQERTLHDAYTAGRAVIDLYRDEENDLTYATMLLRKVSRNDPASGTMPYLESALIGALEVPTFFRDRPQFMSLDRLRRLEAEPQRSTEVRRARRELVEAMAQRDLLDRLQRELTGPMGAVELTNMYGRRLRIAAPVVIAGDSELTLKSAPGPAPGPGGRVLVTEFLGELETASYTAESGSFELAQTFEEGEPRVNLSLEQVALRDSVPGGAGGEEPTRGRVDLPLLSTREPVLEPLRRLNLAQVLDRAAGYEHKRIAELRRGVGAVINDLIREIASRLHERAATAVNCTLVLLLGAVMSIWLRHRTPLTIFFWCFMPTVAAFLMISSGRHMTGWAELPVASGLVMTWTGNALLLGLVLGVYGRLSRN